MSRALVFLADGFEEVEALSPVDYLRRGGVDVMTVAVPSATMKDKYIVTGSHKIPVIADLSFDEFLGSESGSSLPDLIFFPGGFPGYKNLSINQELISYARKCFEEGKYVTAICGAPAAVLAKTGILKGKKWTCYPGMENEVQDFCEPGQKSEELLSGSSYQDSLPVVTDGTVITSRGAGTSEQFAMELLRVLEGEEVRDTVKVKTIQR